MNIPGPNHQLAARINESRHDLAFAMGMSGHPDAPLLVFSGVCAADSNRLPNGELAFVAHGRALGSTALKHCPNTLHGQRVNGDKPRTREGYRGLLHEPDGIADWTEGAEHLTRAGVPLAAEIMSDAASAIAIPWLSRGWVGARNVDDTSPRYQARPTEDMLDQGIHPLPIFVKNGADGSLTSVVNALHTIRNLRRTSSLLVTTQGLQVATTHANPHTGVILRGSTIRPGNSSEQALADEIGTARDILDREFGTNTIPVVVDLSHAHANWEGGGEAGQLIMAEALGRLITQGARVDGYMAESYIHPDKQEAYGTQPGLSWTDKCIGEQNAQNLMIRMDHLWAHRPVALALTT